MFALQFAGKVDTIVNVHGNAALIWALLEDGRLREAGGKDMKSEVYTDAFYDRRKEKVLKTAEMVVPVLHEILSVVHPKSVVDVGCGTGEYLSFFRTIGEGYEVLGIDGDYVDRARLTIPADCFTPFDLAQRYTSERRYDFAMSIEVAEHLPESRAESFVEDLTRLSDVIFFTAAVPNQAVDKEGQGHVNEQPISYWVKQFNRLGYREIDCVRNVFWDTPEQPPMPWLVRNGLLYVKEELYAKFDSVPRLKTYDTVNPSPMYKEFNEIYEAKVWLDEQYHKQLDELERLRGRFSIKQVAKKILGRG